MAGRYAEGTTVDSGRSRAEIERTLERYEADEFAYWTNGSAALIGFRISGRHVKIMLPLPDKHSPQFLLTPGRRLQRTPEDALREWEKACRQRWRALALVVKAKLEAVESGISTVEREFLADVVLPNGSTVGEWFAPQLELAYANGQMPALMPGGGRA